ncbi:methylmalonyl-CoA mutase C-terminal domain-containing protein [Eubacterium aggregans]|uniref:Methylmalonyl-CoA mutase C-terminal domain-containing protein n=1 Tax=Eubacterium aggregans TaxID=81409 RepID=A0A1H3Z8H6_9FIRM|nr:B12-binding domain-containing protein [Eubacterium aggregans]SEA19967.1 methylmalonyl-CoA mutase C-terminal domain-containing protein [Eubacterium aggregans]
MADLNQLGEFVVDGNEEAVQNAVNKALEEKVDPVSIINDGLLAGMNIVGEEFKNGEMYVPEVLMAARAMNAGMDIVKPLIADTDMPTLGTIVIGTVKGDLHDIGKNLVVMMLESAGFKIVDVGVDASPEDFVAAAVDNNADIVAMSAMLTTTMQMMDKVVAACKDAGVDAQYLIGGAPVSTIFSEKIGAVYAADASAAVENAKELVG